MHRIGNFSISGRTKLYSFQIDKSEHDKDEEVGDISSCDEEINNLDSRNYHELGNKNISLTHFVSVITSISHPQTLNVYGYVKKTKVKILIYSFSSHNVIDMNIEGKLNICIYPNYEF